MMDKIHTNKAYEQELKSLRDRIVGMGSRIEKMIESSMRALLQNDVALAKATIEFDRNIDREEMLIDKLCVEILARRQPLGQDLRFVVSILKSSPISSGSAIWPSRFAKKCRRSAHAITKSI